MPDPFEELKGKLDLAEEKRTALEERLRALETSYTIDRRVVLVVGAALAALMLAFFGYSVSKLPEKVMEALEVEVQRSTGKTLEQRVKAIDTALAESQQQMSDLQATNARFTSIQDNIFALQQELSQARRSSLAISGIEVAHGGGTARRLNYVEGGYSMPEGYKLACGAGEWLTALTIFTNKDAKFAGYQVDCQQLDVKVR